MLNWDRPFTLLARQNMLPTSWCLSDNHSSWSAYVHGHLKPALAYILFLYSAPVQGHMPSHPPSMPHKASDSLG